MIKVVCAIIVKDQKVLACKRSESMELSGYWEFPGGKVEDGENNLYALKREIKEELNLNTINAKYFGESAFKYPNKKVLLIAYSCNCENSEDLNLLEHEEFKWLGIGELKSIKWAPADLPFVDLLLDDRSVIIK